MSSNKMSRPPPSPMSPIQNSNSRSSSSSSAGLAGNPTSPISSSSSSSSLPIAGPPSPLASSPSLATSSASPASSPSSQTAKAALTRGKSPLNPSYSSSQSSVKSASDHGHGMASGSTTPNPGSPALGSPFSPSPSKKARARGHSISAVPEYRADSSTTLDRVLSGPAAVPASTSAGTVMLSPSLTVRGDEFETGLSSFRVRSRSRSPAPGLIDESVWHKAIGMMSPTGLVSPSHSTWWNHEDEKPNRPWRDPQRKDSVPPEQAAGWDHTRRRVAQAVSSILGTAALVAHEALLLTEDLSELVPVPGLQPAARTLLQIWDSLQLVDLNRLQCLRLTERCAEILLSVRQEVYEAGDMVGEELNLPIAKLVESFVNVYTFLQKQSHRPFLKRYLKRDEIVRQIAACDAGLQDALGMFSLSIQIRILKQVQMAELQRQHDTQEILREMVSARERSESIASLGIAGYTLSQASSPSNALQLTGVDDPNSSRPPWPYSQSRTLPSSASSLSDDAGSIATTTPRYTSRQSWPYSQPLLSPTGQQTFNYMQRGSSQSLLSSLAGLPDSSSHPSLSGVGGRSGSVTPIATGMQQPALSMSAPPPPSVSVTPSSQPSTSSQKSSPSYTVAPLTPTTGNLPFSTTTAATPEGPVSSNLTPLLMSPSRMSPSRVLPTIQSLTQRQDLSDAESDYADLRNLMREALGKGSDVEMMNVLGVKREDMPEAIKTLQRALEALVERERQWEEEAKAEVPAGADSAGVVAVDGVVADPSKRPGLLPRKSSAGKNALAKMARRISMQAGVGVGGSVGFASTSVSMPIAEDEEQQVVSSSSKSGKKDGMRRLKRSKTVSTTTTASSASSTATDDSIQSQAGSSSRTGSRTGPGSGESRPAVLTKDTLEREFIESGIDALRRMSRGAEKALSLPSWTITRYEIDRNEKIGFGFFSDVYKGSWKPSTTAPSKTVAIKVLAETTPRKLFIREISIWKTLSHPNVLELYGASSASGDPPWFFVSPYFKNGCLSDFLRRIAQGEGGRGPPAGLMLGSTFEGGARSRTASLPGWSGGGLGSLVGAHSPAGRDTVGLGLGLGSGPLPSGGISPKSSVAALGASGHGEKKGRGRSGSGSTITAHGGGEIAKEWDLLRFMHEIAKGMEYLHSNGVLHGDLKAANVLVDDRIHCVISDFGQSEMKSEAYRISGTPPPHGTLRWQAPELMSGLSQLTVEMDVYAFAMSCIEILELGRIPWAIHDDDTVRHFVLKDNSRPVIASTRFTTPALAELIRSCWATDPFERPPFSKVAHTLKLLRKNAGSNAEDVQSPRLPDWNEWEFQQKHVSKPSPDMHPIPLPPGSPPRNIPIGPPLLGASPSSSSDATSFQTAPERDVSVSPPMAGHGFVSRREDNLAPTRLQMPETVVYSPSGPPSSRASSIFTSTPSTSQSEEEALNNLVDYDGYDSPPPADERIAAARNERRYRLLLVHEFHPSLTLSLWSPSPVALGAVGYLSKPKGEFVTLFNAFSPEKSINVLAKGLPSVYGYGKVSTGSQRQDKRNAAQRGFDAIAGLLTFKSRGDGVISQSSARRYSFPLRAGHKTAYLCTETTLYRYVENLDAPKKWFKANVDTILDVFGAQHHIQKEDLFFVIGTLNTPDYALFVSHSHPDGQAHFNIFTSAKTGQPWGAFTTDTEFPSELGGPSYHEPTERSVCATNVSRAGSPLSTVLVARLRFKPDVAEPTSL